MKKVIIIESLLFFVLAVLCFLIVQTFIFSSQLFNQAEEFSILALKQQNLDLIESYMIAAERARSGAINDLLFGLLIYLPSFLAVISTMTIIAVKPLPGIKPIIEKYKSFKEKRKVKKSERDKKNKAKRIAVLEKELTELKKD